MLFGTIGLYLTSISYFLFEWTRILKRLDANANAFAMAFFPLGIVAN